MNAATATEFHRDVEQELATTVVEVGLPDTPEDEVTEAVLLGIELLERKWGPDFDLHLNLATLNLGSVTNCVIGQLYGDFSNRHKLGSYDWVALGFEVGESCHPYTYRELTSVWLRELRARRAELSLSA